MTESLIVASNLRKEYGDLVAVDDVSFEVTAGGSLGIVGESGSGKTTVAKMLVGLERPTAGRIEISGTDCSVPAKRWRERSRRARALQIVFQDPYSSLNPRLTVEQALTEPMLVHGIGESHADRRERAARLLTEVGLIPDHLARYPHEFSGGQRQRICIARALALQPDLIIADESVSALDVSVQARVLDLLRALQKEFGLAYLFISHDMAVVESMADRVAVMYLGQIVEMGTTEQIFGDPQHAYTRRLLDAVPVPDPVHVRRGEVRLSGEVPSPVHAVGRGPELVGLVDAGGGHLVAPHVGWTGRSARAVNG
jgi:peptide/nickel transport system ATP-binding protein